MNQTQPPANKSVYNWLGAGVLVLVVLGLFYLSANDQPADETDTPSATLSSPLSFAPSSPLAVALNSPLSESHASEDLGALRLTLLHSNDTWGYLSPCG
jgi:hypothetical protein